MPILASLGAGAIGAYRMFRGSGVAPVIPYIEDVFSTYVYTGNGGTQTITNGIDLASKGGLVWTKSRSAATTHRLWDTSGRTGVLSTDTTSAQNEVGAYPTHVYGLSNGFPVTSVIASTNTNGATYVAWTFRKQAKFFDVVTYTGNGVTGRTVTHNLGSTPGCIIIKRYNNGTSNWLVYHRSLSNPSSNAILLNLTNAALGSGFWTANPTDTVFYLSSDADANENGASYVAYLFAHDAGGFGLTGSDNVISCGSYTGASSNPNQLGNLVDLGYEPQWLLIKAAQTTSFGNMPWHLFDEMRGLSIENDGLIGQDAFLLTNSSAAEDDTNNCVELDPRGFRPKGGAFTNAQGISYIYIAIRRGPMKIPTSGANVFTSIVRTGTGGVTSVTNVGFSPDLVISKNRQLTYSPAPNFVDKLRGFRAYIGGSTTGTENAYTPSTAVTGWLNNGYGLGTDFNLGNFNLNVDADAYISWNFRRAPGFFDVVCYRGTGSNQTINHNLTVVPEMIIVKNRTAVNSWAVYAAPIGNTRYLNLESDVGQGTVDAWQNTTPTSTAFYVGPYGFVNGNGNAHVAYLFATLPGISKVGSYTGNGGTQQIDCGFTSGARFVLIKRSNNTGEWYIFDTARGINSGNEPFLWMKTNAEQTGNLIGPYSLGFQLNTTSGGVNGNGQSYIFLAIA